MYFFLFSDRLILPSRNFSFLIFDRNTNNSPSIVYPDFLKDREHLYQDRRNEVKDGCKKVNRTTVKNFEFKGILVDERHLIGYCPIAKVSSTFWKRLLTVTASQGKLNSPFDISLGGVRLSRLKDFSKQNKTAFQKKGTLFMFVRDPYARLFSGYENKIYHANLVYWKSIGRQVVRDIRGSHDDIYKNFGFDVTFPEFVKYILHRCDSGKNIDGHFSPMSDTCDPCSANFHYIGKMETFKEDADFLINKWKNEFDDITLDFDDFQKETVLDTAKGRTNFLFQTKKILDEIKFPFIKIMIRTWRDLQIRGYLSKYIEFPYKETEADLITKDEFFEAIKAALNIPVNHTEVKLQRQEALIQAYRQVPIEDMDRLRRYVLKDCLLYGYDDRPEELFDRTVDVKSEFTYLDGL